MKKQNTFYNNIQIYLGYFVTALIYSIGVSTGVVFGWWAMLGNAVILIFMLKYFYDRREL